MSDYNSEFFFNFETNIAMYQFMNSTINHAIEKDHKVIFIEPYRDALEDLDFQIPNNLEKFKEFQLRNLVQFYYTEFENYIYKCIKAILINSPGKMSKRQISIGKIISYNYDIKEVIEFKAEKVVEDLLKKPINKIFEVIKNEYDIKHYITEEELNKLSQFYQIRNLFAHRSGIIDKKFIENYEENIPYKEGEVLKLDSIEINDYCDNVQQIVLKFDHELGITYPQLVSRVP